MRTSKEEETTVITGETGKKRGNGEEKGGEKGAEQGQGT